MCVLKWCPTVSLESVTDILLRNFTAFDFVSQDGVVTGKYHVIIGNPPYVEDSKCGLKLQTRYGNIYANVLIHSSNLLEKNGAMGFVIPLSYISTPRMNRLRSDDAVQSIFDSKRFFNNEYQKNDVRIGHTFFLRNKKKGYEDAIIESGLVGVGHLFDINGNPIFENGEEHILVVTSRYGLSPWRMLEKVLSSF